MDLKINIGAANILPLILIIVGECITPVSNLVGVIFKNISILLALVIIIFSKQKHSNVVLFYILNIFLITGVIISFSLPAALISYYKYLFPFIFLYYGYTIKDSNKLISVLFVFSIINNLSQVGIYILWLLGYSLWFFNVTDSGIAYSNSFMGVLRGTGLLVFFGAYGFFNLVVFFIAYFYNSNSKLRKWALVLSLLGVIFSFSMKAYVVFILLLILFYKNRKIIFTTFLSISIILALFFVSVFEEFSNQIMLRLMLYIVDGDSVRAESYRVMFNEVANLNFVGQGLGAFGGAESRAFNSPFYNEVNFNWFSTPHLATTDTYYPHLFVEVGLIGAIFYLMVLCLPLLTKIHLMKKNSVKVVCAIYIAILFDSLWSFGLNNLIYASLSLTFIYPILRCKYFDNDKRDLYIQDS
ncbi:MULTISPECIES: hypothetical protein [unclassified Carboxylicivirga]|uniref:hypothetical protein n=1 Tax=Carboxylicivirga TaxID=1628153 RepID=UPI003D34C9A8